MLLVSRIKSLSAADCYSLYCTLLTTILAVWEFVIGGNNMMYKNVVVFIGGNGE